MQTESQETTSVDASDSCAVLRSHLCGIARLRFPFFSASSSFFPRFSLARHDAFPLGRQRFCFYLYNHSTRRARPWLRLRHEEEMRRCCSPSSSRPAPRTNAENDAHLLWMRLFTFSSSSPSGAAWQRVASSFRPSNLSADRPRVRSSGSMAGIEIGRV